eukprot:CAMPEP_0182817400 /NCGR_PEP_ID=MMETSP0006_2-20121128/11452_1 /TAXON_ID=97485 /ORGANISM="Prymnesium parvum, Strain Texoma1" /LENGTH=70 /DNA_ID=CAMNT_0024943759 /DNA_START=444 /DNA_END=656 /DNA_ORIENTATION=-
MKHSRVASYPDCYGNYDSVAGCHSKEAQRLLHLAGRRFAFACPNQRQVATRFEGHYPRDSLAEVQPLPDK